MEATRSIMDNHRTGVEGGPYWRRMMVDERVLFGAFCLENIIIKTFKAIRITIK